MDDKSRTTGVIVPHGHTFDSIIGSYKGEMSAWSWWVNVQSGPFDSLWLYKDDNELVAEKLWIDVPEFENTSTSAWTWGFVPKLHSHVILDEWTYFYGSDCTPSEFPERAALSDRLLFSGNGFSPEFFRWLATTKDVFFMHVDGWWEIYTNRVDWQRQWVDQFPGSFLRTWRKAGEPPSAP